MSEVLYPGGGDARYTICRLGDGVALVDPAGVVLSRSYTLGPRLTRRCDELNEAFRSGFSAGKVYGRALRKLGLT